MHSTCVTDKLAQPGTNGDFLEKKVLLLYYCSLIPQVSLPLTRFTIFLARSRAPLAFSTLYTSFGIFG